LATAAEISADIDAVREARMKLASGQRVDEVWRDGRRITFGKVTLDSLTNMLAILESDLERATNEEAGRPRRSSIGYYFGG